jgi:4'-phosphopantetheinyl transferase
MIQPPLPTALEPLGGDEVHVWHFARDRAQGRAPLLALLARYTGTAATALVSGAHGRPRLAQGPAGLDFNWSHSGELAVVALARGVAPGVDVEWVRPRPRAMDLARRFFHPQETAALRAMPAAERERAFFELWTAKEAVLKATGDGISFGLQRLRVGREGALHLAWLDGDDAAAWQLQTLALGADCIAALAWRGAPRRIVVRALATAHAPVQCAASPSSTTPTAP